MKKVKPHNDQSSLKGRCYCALESTKSAWGTWEQGYVETPSGIVAVMMFTHDSDSDEDFTMLTFALYNVSYTRRWVGRCFTRRGIVTKARRFAYEKVNEA